MDNIFNKLEDYILIMNKQGIIKFCNNSLLMKLQYENYEIENSHINGILHKENIMDNIDNYINKEGIFEISTKNNEIIIIQSEIVTEKFKDEDVYFIISRESENDREINEDLKSFIDNAPYCIWMKTLNGEYIYANKATGDAFDMSAEEIIGNFDETLWGEEYVDEIRYDDTYVVNTRTAKVFETMRKKKNGERQWFESYKAPIFSKEGKVKYTAGIGNDVTLKKELEEKLSYSYKRLSKLDNIIDEKYEINTTYKILNNLQHHITEKLGADGLNIWIYNKKINRLVSEFSTGIANYLSGEGSLINIMPEDIYDKDQEGTNSVDKVRQTAYIKMLKDTGVKYVGYYNITFDNEFLGILSILYKESSHPIYNQDDYIKTVCNQIGIIMKNENLSMEVKKELKKRRDIEEELEEFLNTATEVMIIVDEPGRFIKVNPGCEEVLGWSKEELLDMTWQEIIHPDDLDNSIKLLELIKLENSNSKRITNRFRTPNGEFKWLDWGIKYMKCKNKIVCTATDITEQRKMEDERKKYEEKLIHERIKNEFFTNISHEFRTPLNIIISTMQLINKKSENNSICRLREVDCNKYMNSIRQNSYRLLRLVNNLIDITRIDTGYYNINLENNNIVSIVEDIVSSVVEYTGNKGVSVTFDTEVEEKIIACDPDKIERVMLNLLSNAIKYTGENGKIYVDLKVELNNVIISVRDNGVGVPIDKLETIFERFIQVDSTLARTCEGSGIGLSLVKSLVEMHGGTINVKSTIGEFTEFTFTIPIRTLENESKFKIQDNTITSKVEKCNVEFSDIYKDFKRNI